MRTPEQSKPLLVGVDTGGTFTDIVVLDGTRQKLCKVLSTPDDPSKAIFEGLDRLGLADRPVLMVHGTTVGTNAVLEGKGARVAYVTSRGFGDVLELGRQNRESVYALLQPQSPPPVPEDHCLEVSSRLDAAGRVLAAADADELAELAAKVEQLGVEAVAINLLFGFLNPDEEARIAEAMPHTLLVSCSSEVLPEIREFERGMATWLNASVGPVIRRYLARLSERLPKATISVMQSSGTTVAAEQAATDAARLLLSGPAGGVAAARLIGRVCGQPRLMTLDMGGTSTDVALLDGAIPLANRARIGRWPLHLPTVDIHTIGAGGGSVAQVDAGGLLMVGPESAGANPGPACYGQGGEAVTVTDANLVLGRIPGGTLLGGYLPLDVDAAKAAMDRLSARLGGSRFEAAEGVVRIANEHMARALRVISVERGHDPRDYALLCFGGAGGLHACDLAELLQIRRVIMPALAGVLSAQGMLASEPGRDLSLAILEPVDSIRTGRVEAGFETLEAKARSQLEADGIDARQLRYQRRLELRYAGQSATLMLDFDRLEMAGEQFHRAHEAESGHRLALPVELVNLRLGARAPAAVSGLEVVPARRGGIRHTAFVAAERRQIPVMDRDALADGETLSGPAIIGDSHATTWLASGWSARRDFWGNLLLEKENPP